MCLIGCLYSHDSHLRMRYRDTSPQFDHTPAGARGSLPSSTVAICSFAGRTDSRGFRDFRNTALGVGRTSEAIFPGLETV